MDSSNSSNSSVFQQTPRGLLLNRQLTEEEQHYLLALWEHPGYWLLQQALAETRQLALEGLVREDDQIKMVRLQERVKAFDEAINLREVFFPRTGGRRP